LKISLTRFFTDFLEYLLFFRAYLRRNLLRCFYRFETIKSKLVERLYRQRGKYIRPFLHTSMIGIVLVGLMLAPLLKEAIFTDQDQYSGTNSYLLAVSANQNSVQTQYSVKPRDSVLSYSVLPGDTISTIAEKFSVSADTVLWQNNLEDDDTLKPGDILEIPPVTGIIHKVKRGETVYSIAEEFSAEAQAIVNWPFNTFANDETFALATGQLLVIPDGIKPAAKPVPVERSYVAYRQTTPDAGLVAPSGSFAWPAAGYISQYPVWYHMAIDIANPSAPDVTAADSGTVVSVVISNVGYGHHVIVDHGNGYQTLYGHMTNIYVAEGQTVAKGAAIGKMGSTGRSTGVHLHFEIRQGGVLQNPLSFLQ